MIKFVSFFENNNKSKNGIVVNNLVYDISKFYSDSLMQLILDGNLNNEMFHNELIRNIDKLPKSQHNFLDLQNATINDRFGLNIPYRPNEVWACGVTYKKNMELHEKDIEDSVREKISLCVERNAYNSKAFSLLIPLKIFKETFLQFFRIPVTVESTKISSH